MRNVVALSKAQKEILTTFKIPAELQNWMALEFNGAGEPKGLGAPDFLLVLSDLLHAADVYLDSQRAKLARLQNPTKETKVGAEEWRVAIANLEETIKESWLNATAFWRVIEQVMHDSAYYQVAIQRKHIQYAFQKKNLALIQTLKWAHPEFFTIPSSPFFIKLVYGTLGFMSGLGFGLIGEILGAQSYLKTKPLFLRPFLSIIYTLLAIIPGVMRGSIIGSATSFEIGNIGIGSKMAYYGTRLDPLMEPLGSKKQQAVELKKQNLIFKLSEQLLS